MWARSIEIEPRSSDTLKRRNCERRWPGLSLKSPGIRPKGLPGKNHPNPLPKIGSRHSKDENVSPLGSPSFGSPVAVFKQSPVSTPVTPSYQTSPRESDSSLRLSFSSYSIGLLKFTLQCIKISIRIYFFWGRCGILLIVEVNWYLFSPIGSLDQIVVFYMILNNKLFFNPLSTHKSRWDENNIYLFESLVIFATHFFMVEATR